MNGNATEYLITPRIPGVRPQDPPDYDGITFVYLMANVLTPWVMPPQLQNVVLVVDNAQGFVPGMSIIIEGAGSFQVVETDALNRMTVENLGYFQNAAPGAGIAPGKITTTSLPGPKGDQGPQGIPGNAATVDVGSTVTSPPGQNAQVTNSGSSSAAVLQFTIPRGLVGPAGPQGAPGQAYSSTTTAAFSAAAAPTAQPLQLQSTAGLFKGVTLNIDPIGYYQINSVDSPTQVTVVNNGTPTNAAPGTVSPSGSAVLGTGPQGPPGATGPAGAAGPQGNVGPIGPAGAQGPQGIAGVAGPTGPTGPQGVAGAQGPSGAQGAPGTTGPTGPAGAAGPTGAAATVAVGTTSTGAPGTNASVTNTGSPGAAVFNFTIPQGDVGANGPAGATGANAWTLTGASFTIPPIGQTVVVQVADTSWVAVGETVWVAGTPDALVVQAKTPTSLTLLNPQTSGNPGVSTDAGNQAKLGSDHLIYVPFSSITQGFVGKTSAYTLTSADSGKYIICSGGSWTLTLPVPAAGMMFQVRNDMGITGTTGIITLQPNTGTINGLASLPLLAGQEIQLFTDGVNWRGFGRQREVVIGIQDLSAVASGVVLLPPGYRYFELEFTAFNPAAADFLAGQLSSDGGNTWITAQLYHGMLYNSSATAAAFADLEASGTFFYILATTVAGYPYGEGKIVIYPGAPGTFPTWRIDSIGRATAYQYKWNGGGLLATAGAVNAFKYLCGSGGNFTCNLTVKGVV